MSVLRSLFRRQLLSEDLRAGSSVSPALERCATAGEPLPGDEQSTSTITPPRALSLPASVLAPHSQPGSLSPAPSSLSSGSDAGSPMASPTALQAAAAAAEQQAPRRRQLRAANGMDAYDYWSLIKSL